MGIFNFFITLPQIINGLIGGIIVKYFYRGESIYAIVTAGIFLVVAAISVLYVREVDITYTRRFSLAKTTIPKDD
jgi:maltose/moltooligosaccharide transporter